MMRGIITVSDVVIGYGSPQILRFTESLMKKMSCDGAILQPLLPSRPIVSIEGSSISFLTISTALHVHSSNGLDEYHRQCAKIIEDAKPEVLVLSNYNLLPIIEHLAIRPKKIVMLALEDFDQFVGKVPRKDKFHCLAKNVGYWIFPESHRASRDSEILGIAESEISILYNVSENNYSSIKERNGRIVYAGTLDQTTSIGKYIFDSDLAKFKIDVYGDLQGSDSSIAQMKSKLNFIKNNIQDFEIKWYGQIPLKNLDFRLPSYNYSVVFWLPIRDALFNAAPNKFFQAVSKGVPLITAPHPQTKMLVERYGCGIVLDGWSKTDLIKGLRKAESLLGTSAYERMVHGCQLATESELNWNAQFEKFSKRFNVES